MKKYELLSNSLTEFKRNVSIFKKFKFNSDKNLTQIALTTNSTNNSTKGSSSINAKLNFYMNTLHSIREIVPNLKLNKSIIYEYYKAICYFYIEKNATEAMKILMN